MTIVKPARMTAAFALAVLGLALASQLEIPLRPVPLTLQSLAVVLAGLLLGSGLGCAATVAWLALGAAGLPVFADGAGGIDHLTGPTAGYLLAFPLAAAIAGIGRRRRSMGWRTGVGLLAHALILVVGAAWLATQIGTQAAIDGGLTPFLPGAFIKSVLAAALSRLVQR